MPNIDVKAATMVAMKVLEDLFPNYNQIQLEEVETDRSGNWKITFSYTTSKPGIISSQVNRDFKVVTVNKEGNVDSIRMKEFGD